MARQPSGRRQMIQLASISSLLSWSVASASVPRSTPRLNEQIGLSYDLADNLNVRSGGGTTAGFPRTDWPWCHGYIDPAHNTRERLFAPGALHRLGGRDHRVSPSWRHRRPDGHRRGLSLERADPDLRLRPILRGL